MGVAKRFSAGSAWVLLPLAPSVAALYIALAYPYLPRAFDDGEYWSHTLSISDHPFGLPLLAAMYGDRPHQKVLMPLLGLAPYLVTGSVAVSTAILMPFFLAVCGAALYRLFLHWLPPGRAAAGALAMALSPAIFEGAFYYMGELPFLCACLLGLLAVLSRAADRWRFTGAVLSIGLSLCLRPVEGVFFWACVLVALCWKMPARRSRALKAAAVGLLVAGLWFLPSFGAVAHWVQWSFFDGTKVPLSGGLLLSRAGEAGLRLTQAYRPAGLLLVALAFAVSLARAGRAALGAWLWAFGAGFAPFLAGLVMVNRGTAGELRYYIGFYALGMGFAILTLGKERWAPAALAVLVAANAAAARHIADSRITYELQTRKAMEACRALGAATPVPLPTEGIESVLVISDSIPLLSSATCEFTLGSAGRHFHGFSAWPFFEALTRRFQLIILVTEDERALFAKGTFASEIASGRLRIMLESGHYARLPFQVTVDGRSYRAAAYKRRD